MFLCSVTGQTLGGGEHKQNPACNSQKQQLNIAGYLSTNYFGHSLVIHCAKVSVPVGTSGVCTAGRHRGSMLVG